jgi:hypothetical protein
MAGQDAREVKGSDLNYSKSLGFGRTGSNPVLVVIFLFFFFFWAGIARPLLFDDLSLRGCWK